MFGIIKNNCHNKMVTIKQKRLVMLAITCSLSAKGKRSTKRNYWVREWLSKRLPLGLGLLVWELADGEDPQFEVTFQTNKRQCSKACSISSDHISKQEATE